MKKKIENLENNYRVLILHYATNNNTGSAQGSLINDVTQGGEAEGV